VVDWLGEEPARAIDDVSGQPVRASVGVGGNDDLVDQETMQCLGDRQKRSGVSDPAVCLDSVTTQLLQVGAEAQCGFAPRLGKS
jgi:hypothetical protein